MIDVVVQRGEGVRCNVLPQSNLLEKIVCPVNIIVHNHKVVHSRLFGKSNLLESDGQPLSDRLITFRSTTFQAGFERCERRWGYEDVERVQARCFDLSNTLMRSYFGSATLVGCMQSLCQLTSDSMSRMHRLPTPDTFFMVMKLVP